MLRLDRAERAEARVRSVPRAEGLGQRRDLDRDRRAACRCRAPRRSRCVAGRRRPTASAAAITSAWPSTLGRGVADLERAVVVDRRAVDHRADRVAVGAARRPAASAPRRRRRCRTPCRRRLRVEGAAVAVRREDAALLVAGSRPAAASVIETPPASAMSHSPASRLWQARCTATSEVEQAVCTVRLGPAQVELVGRRAWPGSPCRCRA